MQLKLTGDGFMELADDELANVLGGDRDSGWDNIFEGVAISAGTALAVAAAPHVTIPILIAGAAGFFAGGAEIGWGAAQIAKDKPADEKPDSNDQSTQSSGGGGAGSVSNSESYGGESPSFPSYMVNPEGGGGGSAEIVIEPIGDATVGGGAAPENNGTPGRLY